MDRYVSSLILIAVIIAVGALYYGYSNNYFGNKASTVSKVAKSALNNNGLEVNFLNPPGTSVVFQYDPSTNSYIGFIKFKTNITTLKNSPLSVVNIPGAQVKIVNVSKDGTYTAEVIIPAESIRSAETSGIYLVDNSGNIAYYPVETTGTSQSAVSVTSTTFQSANASNTTLLPNTTLSSYVFTYSTLSPRPYWNVTTIVTGNPTNVGNLVLQNFYVVPIIGSYSNAIYTTTLTVGRIPWKVGEKEVNTSFMKPSDITKVAMPFLRGSGKLPGSNKGVVNTTMREYYKMLAPLRLVFVGGYLQSLTPSLGIRIKHNNVFPRGKSKDPFIWVTYFYDMDNVSWYNNATVVSNLTLSLDNVMDARLLLYVLKYGSIQPNYFLNRHKALKDLVQKYKPKVGEIIENQNYSKNYDLFIVELFNRLYVVKNGQIIMNVSADNITNVTSLIKPGYKVLFVGVGKEKPKPTSGGRIVTRGSIVWGGGSGSSSTSTSNSKNTNVNLVLPMEGNTYVFDLCSISSLIPENGVINNTVIIMRSSKLSSLSANESYNSLLILPSSNKVNIKEVYNTVVAGPHSFTANTVVNSSIVGAGDIRVAVANNSVLNGMLRVVATQLAYRTVINGFYQFTQHQRNSYIPMWPFGKLVDSFVEIVYTKDSATNIPFKGEVVNTTIIALNYGRYQPQIWWWGTSKNGQLTLSFTKNVKNSYIYTFTGSGKVHVKFARDVSITGTDILISHYPTSDITLFNKVSLINSRLYAPTLKIVGGITIVNSTVRAHGITANYGTGSFTPLIEIRNSKLFVGVGPYKIVRVQKVVIYNSTGIFPIMGNVMEVKDSHLYLEGYVQRHTLILNGTTAYFPARWGRMARIGHIEAYNSKLYNLIAYVANAKFVNTTLIHVKVSTSKSATFEKSTLANVTVVNTPNVVLSDSTVIGSNINANNITVSNTRVGSSKINGKINGYTSPLTTSVSISMTIGIAKVEGPFDIFARNTKYMGVSFGKIRRDVSSYPNFKDKVFGNVNPADNKFTITSKGTAVRKIVASFDNGKYSESVSVVNTTLIEYEPQMTQYVLLPTYYYVENVTIYEHTPIYKRFHDVGNELLFNEPMPTVDKYSFYRITYKW